ncbi:MAG: 3-deoxy-7-phosphoheptulonate synthase [Flavobacteriia bacterium]|nr:3-deoxy-7-phosphoheptulonate synthase [Flavobacteriia bacterium]
MIIKLHPSVGETQALALANTHKAFLIQDNGLTLITGSSLKEIPADLQAVAEKHWVFPNDMQLSSKVYKPEVRSIQIGNTTIGGNTKHTVLIGGPCSVESEEQLENATLLLKKLNLHTLRGGAYKPRTSPYSFQGMGLEGLQLLAKMKAKYGVNVITEARDATHIEEIIAHTDIIQIGAKAMYDQGILRACAKIQKPVLIKRGFGTTLQELVQAAEFVLSGGNPNVMVCERGIRTFETGTRFTLDLCGVAWLREHTNLPIILDPSHAMGYAYGVASLAKACVAMGVDGLLIETHPNPKIAKSDASQQLTFEAFEQLYHELKPVAAAVGYQIV